MTTWIELRVYFLWFCFGIQILILSQLLKLLQLGSFMVEKDDEWHSKQLQELLRQHYHFPCACILPRVVSSTPLLLLNLIFITLHLLCCPPHISFWAFWFSPRLLSLCFYVNLLFSFWFLDQYNLEEQMVLRSLFHHKYDKTLIRVSNQWLLSIANDFS